MLLLNSEALKVDPPSEESVAAGEEVVCKCARVTCAGTVGGRDIGGLKLGAKGQCQTAFVFAQCELFNEIQEISRTAFALTLCTRQAM